VAGTDTQARSVYIWIAEGTWRVTVGAALDLTPAGARFTVLHVTTGEVTEAGAAHWCPARQNRRLSE